MMTRMYILLTRPHKALEELGATDNKTPFAFFLFFSFILSFLYSLLSNFWIAFFVNTSPGTTAALVAFLSTIPSMLVWVFYNLIPVSVMLGISVIILSAGLWILTGTRSWNPAFSICAYSLPVFSLVLTVYNIIVIPTFPFTTLSHSLLLNVLWAIATIIGYLLVFVISAYGIMALTGIPKIPIVTVVIFWLVVTYFATGAVGDFILFPLNSGFSDLLYSITKSWFPTEFPAAGSTGTIP